MKFCIELKSLLMEETSVFLQPRHQPIVIVAIMWDCMGYTSHCLSINKECLALHTYNTDVEIKMCIVCV